MNIIMLIARRKGLLGLLLVALLGMIVWHTLRSPGTVQKYVSFLKEHKQSPVEYILNLFERHDLVILCERSHPEVTQYELIYELVNDSRFQQQVGHVFTELGSVAVQPFLEKLLCEDALTEAQLDEAMRYLAGNFASGEVLWTKHNIFDFLRRVYHLNRSLPPQQRIHVYPTDIAFRWEDGRAAWADYRRQASQRDKLEADHIVGRFKDIRALAVRNKALVIMNYRHAFPHLRTSRNETIEATGGFLMAAYPGRVANVMINSVRILRGSSNQQVRITAVQEGKWDAAFAVVGNPSVGFDFSGSPMGEDRFDFHPLAPRRLRYQDVFTGFVFFRPLEEHRLSYGLPGLIEQSFADELLRRYRICGENRTREAVVEEIKRLETARMYHYDDEPDGIAQSDCARAVRRWVKGRD